MSSASSPLPSPVAVLPRLEPRAGRVLLRPLTPADSLDLFAIYGDADTMRHASDEPFPSPETVALMLDSVATLLARQESFEWGIECRATGQLIGTCGLHGFDEARSSAEVGCLLRRDRWGQGLMPEALTLLFGWARQQGIRTLRADIDAGNLRSQALFSRLGFEPDGQGLGWRKLDTSTGLPAR